VTNKTPAPVASSALVARGSPSTTARNGAISSAWEIAFEPLFRAADAALYAAKRAG
jgi:hypothetical protein